MLHAFKVFCFFINLEKFWIFNKIKLLINNKNNYIL